MADNDEKLYLVTFSSFNVAALLGDYDIHEHNRHLLRNKLLHEPEFVATELLHPNGPAVSIELLARDHPSYNLFAESIPWLSDDDDVRTCADHTAAEAEKLELEIKQSEELIKRKTLQLERLLERHRELTKHI